MISPIRITHEQYVNIKPFPYMLQDDFLETEFANTLQAEILNIPDEAWDRYDNPFEQKFTLRDKFHLPDNLSLLFNSLTSESFLSNLSELVGYKLQLDETRNFWGVHKYNHGDKLDIHVDAGIHPTMELKKQVTLGIYISSNWKSEYGCDLEIWSGDNASDPRAKLHEKVYSISPLFNRMILFTCNDFSWHGNPQPALCPINSQRIFVTLSYLSTHMTDQNKRKKAFFIARPDDPHDDQKDMLRILRSDPEQYKSVYRTNKI
jgi:Rps23 Pro-64 3,4-dihydroxylase Tpa1-like proline 4-hydroxylase